MAESKSAHLGLLERCNEKRERGESPTIAEQLHLEELLSQHDLRVQAFSAAMKALRESEPAALAALVQLMR